MARARSSRQRGWRRWTPRRCRSSPAGPVPARCEAACVARLHQRFACGAACCPGCVCAAFPLPPLTSAPAFSHPALALNANLLRSLALPVPPSKWPIHTKRPPAKQSPDSSRHPANRADRGGWAQGSEKPRRTRVRRGFMRSLHACDGIHSRAPGVRVPDELRLQGGVERQRAGDQAAPGIIPRLPPAPPARRGGPGSPIPCSCGRRGAGRHPPGSRDRHRRRGSAG